MQAAHRAYKSTEQSERANAYEKNKNIKTSKHPSSCIKRLPSRQHDQDESPSKAGCKAWWLSPASPARTDSCTHHQTFKSRIRRCVLRITEVAANKHKTLASGLPI
jgi:hypothetical protein